MKVFVAVLVLAIAGGSSADFAGDVCADCEFVNGVGYVAGANCRVYHQCVRYANGQFNEAKHCCPNRTKWDQEHLTCVFGYCDAPYDCPEDPGFTDAPCPFEAVEGVQDQFRVTLTGEVLNCSDATVYSQDHCDCIHGGIKTCSDDPLMYFPFAHHFNDIQCHKVIGTPHGDAFLQLDKGDLRLDGDGDFVSFGFLNNYFAWKDTTDLTISLWFYQKPAGWENINNFPVEGLFGNGNCFEQPSIWMTMGNETQQGGVRTDETEAIFENGGADQAARDYLEPEVWCQMSIRYTKTDVSLFLNGLKTATRSVHGTLENTFAASTIGLVYFDCIPFFWTGSIDDVMIFDRYVSDAEQDHIFSLFRTDEWQETPYKVFNP